jgi:hypothetical protein
VSLGAAETPLNRVETLSGEPIRSAKKSCDSTVAYTVSQDPSGPHCDSTVSEVCDSTVSNVESLLDAKKRIDAKKRRDSTATRRKDRLRQSDVKKPDAIPGHEWRRQGTGWTLLRSWYESDGGCKRIRKREYIQHYSASALRRAETLEATI